MGNFPAVVNWWCHAGLNGCGRMWGKQVNKYWIGVTVDLTDHPLA